MTLTGTIVVGKRPSDNDPLPIIYRGEGDPAILDALLDGDKPIDVLGCDETDKCLGPGRRTIPALGGRKAAFEVYFISPAGDYATWRSTRQSSGYDVRSFEVRVRPRQPIDGFRPGMSVLFAWPQG